MKKKFRIKKRHIILLSIFLVIFLLLFFLSSIVRWYLVKNSEELIGRKIELSGLHINYLKVSVRAENFLMYEKNKADTFVSFKELYINFDPWHLFKNEYAFSEIRLDKPYVSLIYADTLFNFNDLIKSDTTKQETEEDNGDTVKFLVKNISINQGYIRYEDKSSGSITEIKDLGVHVPEISWNSRQSELGVDFTLGKDGKVSVGGEINQAAGKFSATLKTENIDIEPYSGYAKPFLNARLIAGKLYTDLKVAGEMKNPAGMRIFGSAGLKDFLVKDGDNKQICAVKDLFVQLDSLDLGASNFRIKKVLLDQPDITAILERGTTNIQRLIAPLSAKDTTAAVQDTIADTTVVHYSIDSVVIKGGNVNFSDLTLNRPFHYNISNLDLGVTGFSDLSTKIPVSFSMLLNKSGSFKGDAIIDMVEMSNVVFKGSIENLDMISLSPYSEYYLARSITKGKFNYKCDLFMNPTKLDNLNNLKIANLEFSKKTKDTTAYKLPMALALYILKDRQGMIKFELPVKGNPSNPTFKLRKIIWKTLEEFLLKAISEPFKAIGNMFGVDGESIKQIPFEIMQDSLNTDQKNKLDKIYEVITNKPELTFNFTQTSDKEKEKGIMAVQKAKYMFVAKTATAGADTNEIKNKAAAIADFDPAFLAFVGVEAENAKGTLVNRCTQLAGEDYIERTFNRLLQKRENAVNRYLVSKGMAPGTVVFKTIDFQNLPEDLKTPKFIIDLTLK
ncbi:MAG TPA: DUF748 domain-containing protein [Bacteroidales bacterium]|nr:DUF748 domain-containing protein [Bacteroidales bacterium]